MATSARLLSGGAITLPGCGLPRLLSLFPCHFRRVFTQCKCTQYWDRETASHPSSGTYQLIIGGDNEHCHDDSASLSQAWAYFERGMPTNQLGNLLPSSDGPCEPETKAPLFCILLLVSHDFQHPCAYRKFFVYWSLVWRFGSNE